ncbi:MAG: hypothetical protein JWM99_2631, partial [Verrucomicrobiales bacterium]|nr:hypothetical protein [Verrucomicrobiales bacterium]
MINFGITTTLSLITKLLTLMDGKLGESHSGKIRQADHMHPTDLFTNHSGLVPKMKRFSIPSDFNFEASVVGFIPNNSAAPPRPNTLPFDCARAAIILFTSCS